MNRQNGNTLIIVLLVLIAALMAAGVGFMYWDSQKKDQAAKLEKAMAYFDKLELEERQAVEAERLKQEQAKLLAEQEKMRLALEKAQEEAQRAKAEAAKRAAEKQVVKQEEYNPCKHVYSGKTFKTYGTYLWTTTTIKWTVIGFSPSSGKASVRRDDDGYTHEIYCSDISE